MGLVIEAEVLGPGPHKIASLDRPWWCLSPRLTSAEEYFKELSKQCLSSESDGAKQKAHREEEIQNLKTALKELEE